VTEAHVFEMRGKDLEVWNRIIGKLAGVIEASVSNMTEKVVDADDRREAASLAAEIATAMGQFATAKLQKPTLENQKTLAEIHSLYEDIKRKQVDTDRAKIALEKDRFDFDTHRLETAFRLLGLLNQLVHRDESGNVTLVFTNRSLLEFNAGMKELNQAGAVPP